MALYAGRSVGYLEVSNFKGGTSSAAGWYPGIPSQKEVTELEVRFLIDISYSDHPHWDNGIGRFKVWLDVLREGGWVQVPGGYATKDLGNDKDDGDWSDYLEVKHTMQNPMEEYRIRTECRTKKTSMGTSVDSSATFTCVQHIGYIGDFTLDFIPLSIVYCPPGQDMTNSLSHTKEYATLTTVGHTSTLQSSEGGHAGGSLFGIATMHMGYQESQSFGNTSQSGIEISEFRNTVVTADNQRAIGRAYWGPLSDLFVIMVNPKFSASKRADGTIFYEHNDCDQLLIVPAHKLLRPGDDPVVSNIPAEDRMRLLELDPFIQNLHLFFPNDTGEDLRRAANPYADPSSNYRAEPIGLWYLNPGTELNYSIGEELKLTHKIGYEEVFTTTMRGEAALIIGGSSSFQTQVGIQWSKEVKNRLSKSASCYLIKNQNDTDQHAIKLYYDRNFGTIMFQKINTAPVDLIQPLPPYEVGIIAIPSWVIAEIPKLFPDLPWPDPPWEGFPDLTRPDLGLSILFPDLPQDQIDDLATQLKPVVFPNKSALGTVVGSNGLPIFLENVKLLVGDSVVRETVTNGVGQFRFDNLFLGEYSLQIGDRTQNITIKQDNSFHQPATTEVKNVRRIIDLNTSPIWKFRETGGLTSENINHLRKAIDKYSILDQNDFSIAIQKTGPEFEQIMTNMLIEFPRIPLTKIESITSEQIAKLKEINISSIRELWMAVKEQDKLDEIAEKTGIDKDTISKWVDKADSNRVSKQEEMLIPPTKEGLLRKLLLFIRSNRMLWAVLLPILIGLLIGLLIGRYLKF
ncbi:MAG: carboxypeptidase-like regulatory domain-containing protein [Candidatus Hodarchaeota archaeon]